jgi:molybdopterin-guanine dinucleotide biosynthesis protein A
MNTVHPKIEELGAVVLCGGSSSRMGYEKFKLPFLGKTFLECVVEQLLPTVDGPVVIVGNRKNVAEIVELTKTIELFQTDRIRILADEIDGLGPVEGIRVGLKEVQSNCRWAFVTCCDTPLIKPLFVRFLAHDISDSRIEAIVPKDHARTPHRIYGMSAIYQTSPDTIAKIDSLIQEKNLRVSSLSDALFTLHVPVEDIRSVDENLTSFLNLNNPQEYREFLKQHDQTCPETVLAQLKKA